jgi:transcription initiation factor TFIIIB Brf1 subunit/transcription initiation factor TFIIB
VNFSEQIIIDVADLYEQIRLASDDFYRKDTKLGILAGCLYFVCHRHGITKRHSTIANMMGVNDKFAAKGEGIIRGLVDEKRIFVETQIDTIHDFAKQYMAALDIDLKYLPFVTDLIKQADHMGLHYTYEPKPTTKCASAIYMLVVRKKMTIMRDGEVRPISKEDISQECMISVTTFMRYYKILYDNHERIEKVFNKHRIPKPVEWRRNRKKVKKTPRKPKL